MAAESASGMPLELIGLVTPLPADGGGVPGEIVEHEAHAAVLLADRGVLLAGDMLSELCEHLVDQRQGHRRIMPGYLRSRVGWSTAVREVRAPELAAAVGRGSSRCGRVECDHGAAIVGGYRA